MNYSFKFQKNSQQFLNIHITFLTKHYPNNIDITLIISLTKYINLTKKRCHSFMCVVHKTQKKQYSQTNTTLTGNTNEIYKYYKQLCKTIIDFL